MWEKRVAINTVCEIRSRSTVYLGVGAIEKFDAICGELKKRGISRIAIVTGRKSYRLSGAWSHVESALQRHSISFVQYDAVTPNPTVDQVDEAAKQARDFQAQAVLAIGGGSPIDAGKAVAALLGHPERDARQLMTHVFAPERAVPIVTINLTHGTGTEANRFAVVTIPEHQFKPAIAADVLYPLYSIDDPALMAALPADQTLYVTLDALNHSMEAATTTVTTPYAIMTACESVRLIGRYLPAVVKNPADLEARYFLCYAAMLAGIAFDNGLLHCTHALEHPLSAMKPDLAHGLGLAVLLPAVVRAVYPERPEVMADLLSPIVRGLQGKAGESDAAYAGVRGWLREMGITQKLGDIGFVHADVDRLADLVYATPGLEGLVGLSPFGCTRSAIKNIYLSAF